MSTLYLIGGAPRTGKTTVVKEFLEHHPMPLISTDALRFGLRNALIGESYISVEKLALDGEAEYRRPGKVDRHQAKIHLRISEDELAWKAAIGMIHHYDRRDEDILVEGMVFNPEDVHALSLGKISTRAVFLGVGNHSHVETILEHARHNPSDWINRMLEENENNDSIVREWVKTEVERSTAIAQSARSYNYGYVDVTQQPYPDYIETALKYLISAAESIDEIGV